MKLLHDPFHTFQFHKGTIRTKGSKYRRFFFQNFNSIKVRLELSNGEWDQTVLDNFNSIKVRLEREFAAETAQIVLFQFHKGTIRTFFHGKKSPTFFRFQFHKGTIRTSAIHLYQT